MRKEHRGTVAGLAQQDLGALLEGAGLDPSFLVHLYQESQGVWPTGPNGRVDWQVARAEWLMVGWRKGWSAAGQDWGYKAWAMEVQQGQVPVELTAGHCRGIDFHQTEHCGSL